MNTPDEGALLAQARQNNQSAFAALMQRYERPLENIVRPLVADQDAARDIVQEAIMRAWRKLHLYKEKYRFSTWFFRIGVNLAITARRRRLLEQRLLERECAQQARDRSDEQRSGLDELLRGEDALRLTEALTRLPQRWREILEMRYARNMDVRDIAREVESSPNSVSIVIHRAKERLKELLKTP